MNPTLSLVADIGGTNARFGLLDAAGRTVHTTTLHCAGHATLVDAARAYLALSAPSEPPRRGAFCIAGPVTGDRVGLTNHPWRFSVAETQGALGLERLVLVNDFTAVALSVPLLGPDDRRVIGNGAPEPDSVIGVIGPGTGLGVSGLIPGAGGYTALAGEGGHVTMSPADDRESAVLAHLRRKHGHVSAERVISGMGLTNLHAALSALDGVETAERSPAEVVETALAGGDAHAVEAVGMFCAMLGTVAGNLALTLGARGGVYIAGGIVPRFVDFFAASAFRERFVEKGRLGGFLRPIPTYVMTHPLSAFLGLKAALDLAERTGSR
jgi:glucokinase